MEHKTYTLNDGRAIKIREIKSNDKDQLGVFYSSLSEDSLKWITMMSRDEMEERFRYPDYFISLVTIHDERVVGYGEITKDTEKSKGELNIHIHQDYQGVGLGTAMMIMLVKEAIDQLLRSINLKVAAENRKAVHLFRKFGFKEQRSTLELYNGEKYDTLHMIKMLNR